MSSLTQRRHKVLIILGFIYILAGLVLNEWTLGQLLASDGKIEKTSGRLIILFFQLALISLGVICIVLRKHDFVINMNLVVVTLFLSSPLTGELLIRAAISFEFAPFRHAFLYADGYSDSDYFKLLKTWFPETDISWASNPDLALGWAPEKSLENPLGIIAGDPYDTVFNNTILFFGDSFVQGQTPMMDKLPQLLDREISSYKVYNYGVAGYGVDQIYLRFLQTYTAFKEPIIIVGILTTDLDRSVLAIRDRPKPYFSLENGKLKLQGTPVNPDIQDWIKQNPVQIKSYLYAFIRQRMRLLLAGDDPLAMEYKQLEKKKINKRIIEVLINTVREDKLRLIFVLFYGKGELQKVGWRETFLKELFSASNVPYLDTKQILLHSAATQKVDLDSYYYPGEQGHPNEAGNRVIAKAIAELLGGLDIY